MHDVRGRTAGHLEARIAQPGRAHAERLRVTIHFPPRAKVGLDGLTKASHERRTRAARTPQRALQRMCRAHSAHEQRHESRFRGSSMRRSRPLKLPLQTDDRFLELMRFERAVLETHRHRAFE